MPDDDVERRLQRLESDHQDTRWLTLRLDRDIAMLNQRAAEAALTQQEHTARFDSIDAQLGSLTQLVGEVLRRLPDPDESEG